MFEILYQFFSKSIILICCLCIPYCAISSYPICSKYLIQHGVIKYRKPDDQISSLTRIGLSGKNIFIIQFGFDHKYENMLLNLRINLEVKCIAFMVNTFKKEHDKEIKLQSSIFH